MQQSLLCFALNVARAVQKAEKIALDKQQQAKMKKQDILCNKKMIAIQTEYTNAVMYIEMFHSAACW